MTTCNPGDIVLVRFPFTDLSTTKKRPGVVISPSTFGAARGDVVLLALTGIPQTDESLRMHEWQSCGLLRPTWVKPLIATVSNRIVAKQLGTIHERDMKCAIRALHLLIADRFRLQL